MMPRPIRELGSCESMLNVLAQIACLRLRSFARSLSAAGWCLVFVKAKARNRVQAQPAGGMMPRPIRELGSCESMLNVLAQIACLRLRSFAINLSAADGSLVFVKAKARNCLWAQPTAGSSLVFVKAKARNCLWAQPTTKTPRRSKWSAGELLLPANTRISFYFALDCS